jgi:hypothetical protein
MEIKKCSSCGKDHSDISARLKPTEVMSDGNIYDGHFYCPETKALVYFKYLNYINIQ